MSEEEKVATSLVGGIVFTVVLVLIVPFVTEAFIHPVVTDAIGDTTFAGLSSGLIDSLVMLGVSVLFMMLLGGGAILKRFGIIGVIGLIIGYWLMGNPAGCVFPIIMLVVMTVLSAAFGKKGRKHHSKHKKHRANLSRRGGPGVTFYTDSSLCEA